MCVVIPAVAELAVGQTPAITDVAKTLEQTRFELEQEEWPYRGRKLGLVLTWAIAPNDQRGQAIDLAEQFNEQILVDLLDHADSGTARIPSREFWTSNGRTGNVKLDLYFIVDADAHPPVPQDNQANDPAHKDQERPGDCDVWRGPDD